MKRICTLLLAMVLLLNVPMAASAESTVIYDASANKFIFTPGTENHPENLFEEFQNVMPGDVLTEEIQIRNSKANGVKIRVYLRSLGAQSESDEFLSQLHMTVKQRGKSILFDAPADQTAQLDDWIYLGTIYSGGVITLDVTLEVPITMGNEFQHYKAIGYLDWEFKVEEHPIEDSDPKTGDPSEVFFYAGVMVISLSALLFLLLTKKKRKEEEEEA